MATFRIYGPYTLDLGPAGISPGQTIWTQWYGWTPQPKRGRFTVTASAHPQLHPTPSASSLAVTVTTVDWNSVLGGENLIVRALLSNQGSAVIRNVQLCITFIEL